MPEASAQKHSKAQARNLPKQLFLFELNTVEYFKELQKPQQTLDNTKAYPEAS